MSWERLTPIDYASLAVLLALIIYIVSRVS